MSKILGCLFLTLLLSVITIYPALAQIPKATSTQTISPVKINSYELFYPIVAGITEGDFWYNLKLLREAIAEKLTFGDIKKADYHLILSKKRLVEAEKLLLVKKDLANAKKTLEKSTRELKTALSLAQTAQEKGKKVKDLYQAISSEASKEVLFLASLKAQLQPDWQDPVQKAQEAAGSVIAEIQVININQ
ncbi:hypothetical protein HY388_00735 [Candidatus Daviesbacteria bacterium]|nr:hypothetical protein [Candidatus Daviesbacteria bacterium]